jgi:ferrous iron transport protein A
MELGLVPGTTLAVKNVAPLGDPLEIEVRGCRLSIRHAEAADIELTGPFVLPEKHKLKVVS